MDELPFKFPCRRGRRLRTFSDVEESRRSNTFFPSQYRDNTLASDLDDSLPTTRRPSRRRPVLDGPPEDLGEIHGVIPPRPASQWRLRSPADVPVFLKEKEAAEEQPKAKLDAEIEECMSKTLKPKAALPSTVTPPASEVATPAPSHIISTMDIENIVHETPLHSQDLPTQREAPKPAHDRAGSIVKTESTNRETALARESNLPTPSAEPSAEPSAAYGRATSVEETEVEVPFHKNKTFTLGKFKHKRMRDVESEMHDALWKGGRPAMKKRLKTFMTEVKEEDARLKDEELGFKNATDNDNLLNFTYPKDVSGGLGGLKRMKELHGPAAKLDGKLNHSDYSTRVSINDLEAVLRFAAIGASKVCEADLGIKKEIAEKKADLEAYREELAQFDNDLKQ